MAFSDDLSARMREIFGSRWETRDGRVVPDPEDLALGNEAVVFERATVLYADMADSTKLVDGWDWSFAAEIYKAYLHCAAALIRAEGGAITSYDGDRVMGIWIGDHQSTAAVRCALKINYAVQNVINPALAAQYRDVGYRVRQVVGVDTSPLRAARTGVRGGNDLVWVGRCANYAAKLTAINSERRTWITKEVFERVHDNVKFGGADRKPMWTPYLWSTFDNRTIYGSTWTWVI